VLALLLVAASLGLSNFGAAIGLGMAGVDAGVRIRAGLVFGVFETGMPILGLVLGHGIARTLGHATQWLAAGLLIATGCYMALLAGRGLAGARAGRSFAGRRAGRGLTGRGSAGRGFAERRFAGRRAGRGHPAAGAGRKQPASRAGRGHPARWADRGDPAPRTGRVLVTGLAVSADNLVAGFALGTYHVGIAVAAITIGAVSVALSLLGLELGDRVGAKIAERGELLGGLVLAGVGIAIAAGVL
jgi:putative Mn2+ efflux pump MntP